MNILYFRSQCSKLRNMQMITTLKKGKTTTETQSILDYHGKVYNVV